ncbi:GNAT family N-acetyltransferase [Roseobacter sp. HKCCD9010]|uniref:GNAT family N-acetyltransferase n=1 Tax=unclassified Roseobacter TaxID=196798 RepID=UPI0014930DDB|nr:MULTISPECIES: GNAT family N-acetyltransferase [unclassified Roseobacter]MBF9050597.1 GNAT family N-acetyltransferase [Rhodobacterales bacterium HKCCD4356]NNV11984.1 GNAT family N-acetyltransferase [Roseobacter sp. HKCCD7357]NNV16997.1 GNAT family N-acetyltransferase [Roseobacter sp. HKCCD8768]NNV26227.1 GNAT family N-acetyltransferase [Roseobacter sp. HKCCD8192]NNV30722.1 GNAT family N-acetyltransferase [Roseobacter sp. HKCCD9061]
MSLVIRPACEDDLPGLRALHIANWQTTYAPCFKAGALDAPLTAMMSQKWVPDVLDKAEVAVAEWDGALAGFALWYPHHEEGPYLDNLHTGAGMRGKGVGRHLMRAICADLRRRGLSSLSLVVLEENKATRTVYRHWGGVEGPVFDDPLLGETVPARRMFWPDLDVLEACLAGDATRSRGGS